MNSNPVPQHLIEEARQKGILKGARIQCAAVPTCYGTVAPEDRWELREFNGQLVVGDDDTGRPLIAREACRWAQVITPAPGTEQGGEDGLEEKMLAVCSPKMRDAIRERGEQLGMHIEFKDSDWACHHEHPNWHVVYTTGGLGLVGGLSGWNPIPLHEFLRRLENTKPPVAKIMVNGREVVFDPSGVTVGDRRVGRRIVLAIAERLERKGQPDWSRLKGMRGVFPNDKMAKAAYERLQELGVHPVGWTINEYRNIRWLSIDNHGILGGGLMTADNEVPYGEFLAAVEKLVQGEDFIVAGHPVQFTPNGITVGCTSVDKETVLAIAKRLKA